MHTKICGFTVLGIICNNLNSMDMDGHLLTGMINNVTVILVQCSPQASQDVAACHALAKFYKDTPNPAIPWLTLPRLDLCPLRLTIYVLGKKWETSGLSACSYE